jgi:hypothetical protein
MVNEDVRLGWRDGMMARSEKCEVGRTKRQTIAMRAKDAMLYHV